MGNGYMTWRATIAMKSQRILHALLTPQKTNDPLQAALYGSVSASLKIEGSGPFYELDVLPGLAEARLHSLKEMVHKL